MKLHPCLGLLAIVTAGAVTVGQPQPSRATPLRGGEAAHVDGVDNSPRANWNAYGIKVLLNGWRNPVVIETAGKEIANCVVRNANGKAGDLLGGPLTDDPKFHRLNGALGGRYRECVTSASDIPLFVVNAALAEELLKAAPLPPEQANPDLRVVAKFFSDPAGITMPSVGRCLAAMSPNLVYQVVATTAGSPEEKQALDAAYSNTPDCGVPVPPPEIPLIEQRSALATGLYYWVHRGG